MEAISTWHGLSVFLNFTSDYFHLKSRPVMLSTSSLWGWIVRELWTVADPESECTIKCFLHKKKEGWFLCKSHHRCIMCQLISLQSIQGYGWGSLYKLSVLWPPGGAWLHFTLALEINIIWRWSMCTTGYLTVHVTEHTYQVTRGG